MFPSLLVVVPLLASIVLLLIKDNGVRKVIVKLASLALGALSIATAVQYLNMPTVLQEGIPFMPEIVMAVDVLTAAAILYYCFKHGYHLVALLELLQVGMIMYV